MTAPPVTVRGVQLNRGEAMTAVLGLAVGAFVGVAFDEHPVRPPAHADGLWILLVVVVSARQTMLRGILRGAGALLLGVLAFFAGRRIGYHMLAPAPGFPPRVHAVDLAFWCLVGFVAGVFLGVIACWISAGQGGSPARPRRSRWP